MLGPSSENEILNQNPRFEYIVGMLAPQTSENDLNEQEIDGDASFEGDADYTAGEDDDNEPVFTNRFKTPSSIGISFYLESSTKSFNVDVTWGDYTKASDKTTNKEGKEVDVSTYKRHPQKETVVIDLQEFSKNKEYPLVCDSNVILYVSKIGLKQGYTLITAFLCTMILFGNVGAQPAASFLLKFASFAKFLKQPESLCCFCTNQIFNFFSCNTAVFQCILKNE